MLLLWGIHKRKRVFFDKFIISCYISIDKTQKEAQAMHYDFLIKNGRVIDPLRNIDRVEDVLIRHSKIVPMPQDGGELEVGEVIDATGYLVLPGLIDFHTHMAYRNSDLGYCGDLYGPANGVTAVVDAGTCGTGTYEGMIHEVAAASTITIKSFLHVAAVGIPTEMCSEDLDPALFDVDRMEYLFERYGDEILGFKVRLGDRSGRWGFKPLPRVRELADQFHTHICCHIVAPKESLDVAMPYFKAGDILCHCYQDRGPHNILTEEGKIRPSVLEARERGVIFDAAVGRVNHSLRVIRAALDQGFLPDVISTDLVATSVYRPALFSVLRVMAVFLAMGMPLMEVIRATTQTPAKLMRLEHKIGTLEPGAMADVAIFKMVEKPVTFHDKFGGSVQGNQLLSPQMTIKEGRIAYRNIEFTF